MYKKLFFNDLHQFHGTSLHAYAAGNALGSGILRFQNHDLRRTCLNALTAADTILLVDHINTGFRILGNCIVLTNLHALTALDAGHRLSAVALGYNLDAAKVRIKFLVKCIGACTHTFQTCHTFDILLYSKLFHIKGYSFFYYSHLLYRALHKIAMVKFPKFIIF
jgi:hypothetical protein